MSVPGKPPVRKVVVVGGGPAGLMAAETARDAGADVEVYEQMASPARKFLIAGKGGLNLTHSEPLDAFSRRFRARAPEVGACWQPSGRSRCAAGPLAWAMTP